MGCDMIDKSLGPDMPKPPIDWHVHITGMWYEWVPQSSPVQVINVAIVRMGWLLQMNFMCYKTDPDLSESPFSATDGTA